MRTANKSAPPDCTQATHDQATATRAGFIAATTNRRPWLDLEEGIDMTAIHPDAPEGHRATRAS